MRARSRQASGGGWLAASIGLRGRLGRNTQLRRHELRPRILVTYLPHCPWCGHLEAGEFYDTVVRGTYTLWSEWKDQTTRRRQPKLFTVHRTGQVHCRCRLTAWALLADGGHREN